MTTPLGKVLFVTPYWGTPRTGPEVFAKYLWEAFAKDAGLDFHLVAASEEAGAGNLHLVRPGRGSLALYRDVARAALDLMRRLGGPGILHVNNSNFHRLLFRSPWPVIGQVNDYNTAHFRRRPFRVLRDHGLRAFLAMWRRSVLEARFVRWQALTVCNSEYTLQEVCQAYGIEDRSRIRVVYKAVDVSRFRRPASGGTGPARAGRGRTIVSVGSHAHGKGMDVLVRAVGLLSRPARVVIAGVTRAEFEGRFPGLLDAALHRGSEVVFKGVVGRGDIPGLLWESDAFCLATRSEALGVAVLEAIAAGLPCVATRVGGIPEIARLFPSVRLVESEDAASMAAALDAVLGEDMPVVPMQRLEQVFGREAMVRGTREAYRLVVEGRDGAASCRSM